MNDLNDEFSDATERSAYLEKLLSGNLPAPPGGERLLQRLLNPAIRGPFLETLLRQPLATIEDFIVDVTASGDRRAVSVIVPLLHSLEEPVVLAAIDALKSLEAPAARPALAERARHDPRPSVRARAKSAVAALPADDATPIEEAQLSLRSAYVTVVDGAGAQMALVAREWWDTGELASFHVIFDDVQGITEAFGVPAQAPLELVDMLDDLEDDGLTPVEVALDEVRASVEDAYQKTLAQRGRVSVNFAAWESFLAGDDPREIPPVELPAVTLATDFDLYTECQKLLDLDEFGTWYFELDEISGTVDALNRLQKRRAESDYEGRLVGLIRQTLNGLVPPDRRELFQRRLERQAPLLARIYDDPIHARRALAAAAGMADDTRVPVTDHPLLQEMLVRSLEDALGRPLIDELGGG